MKGSKELATKFETWSGVKDLNFIIPRNFSSLTQKTGGRSVAPVSINGANPLLSEFEDDNYYNGKKNEPSFIGLKSPDHLKKVCNMFRNNDHKTNPKKYMANLKQNINYDNPEIFRGPIKTEIMNKVHGDGILKMKVFKILNPKKLGSQDDSDSEAGNQQNNGNKNIRALIDETNRRIFEISADELLKKVQ
mmetsp:Transcript_2158/g.2067  ORF Transcript_2158/g.2067 Transcript_2158/m.2067 type:complete len:191 (+) Transcript_2158:890-1462(+)